MSDPMELAEAVRIVREQVIPWRTYTRRKALETVLAALEAAGAWQADRAAMCEDRERLNAKLQEWTDWEAMLHTTLERAVGGKGTCDSLADTLIRQLAEARARIEYLDKMVDASVVANAKATALRVKAECERDEAQAEVERRKQERNAALVHGPEDLIRALEEARATKDMHKERQEEAWGEVERLQKELAESEEMLTEEHEARMQVHAALLDVLHDHALTVAAERERDEARAEVERLREMNAGHPTMCCGRCAQRIRDAEAALAAEQGLLATESAERIRCRDGWATETKRSEQLRDALKEILDHVEMQNADVIGAIQDARAALAPAQPEEPNGRGEDGPVQPLTGWGYDTETGEEGKP